MRRGLLALLIAPWIAFSVRVAEGVKPLVLDDNRDTYTLGLNLEYLDDPQAQLTFEDVRSPELDASEMGASHSDAIPRFVPGEQENIMSQSGFIKSAWIRFTLENQSKNESWYINAGLSGHQVFDLYAAPADPSADWTVKRMGDRIPFVEREIKNRRYTHRISLVEGQRQTFYLHIVGAFGMPLTLSTQEAFTARDHDVQIVLGIFYGLVLVMIVYNLFLCISLRDEAYFYYVISMLFGGIFFATLHGLDFEYLRPNSTSGHLGFAILFQMAFPLAMARFVQVFLLTHEHAPRLHKFLYVEIAVTALCGITSFYDPATLIFVKIALPIWLFIVVSFLLAGIFTWRADFRPARFFLIAWSIYILGVVIGLLAMVGIIPFNFLTSNAYQIGFALQVVLMSFALADRINILREEKEAHEAELQTAHDLQLGLMAHEAPKVEGYDIAGRCIPATHVGGDFFQFFERDGQLTLCLADVTGHAMEAAVPVMMFSGMLESEVRHGYPLSDLFASLNEALHEKLDQRTFVCLAMGRLDTATRRFQLSNGACPYPYHYRAASGEIVELEIDAYPLGVRSGSRYEVIEVPLEPGDYVVFCSDGIIEAANTDEGIFGFEQTAETIRAGCAEGLSAEGLIDRLIGAVQEFAGDEPQGDDMTCVALRVEK